jgi:pimeloyl-ACP methyl ester carboxylesterase
MESSAVSADGVPLAFEVRGVGEPTLVFVHGWSCDRGYWKHQLDDFGKRQQVVALDLAGHGQSGVGRDTWTMPSFAQDVVAVADALRLDRMILIGHSMGGDVIVEAARRLPARVEGLVWVDVYRTLAALRSREAMERFVAPFRADFVPTTLDFVRGMFVPSSDPDLVEWVAADMAAAPPDIALDSLEHARTVLPDVIDGLRDIHLPVVAINADNEPTDVEGLRRHGVRAVLMHGVGHFPFLEDPPAFNRLLEETIRELTASAPES